MVTIAVVNNKGGVGKSTLTCSFAQALALVGQKVLCIDNDNQRNLATMLGITNTADSSIRDLYQLKDPSRLDREDLDRAIADCVLESTIPELHCITAPDSLCDDDVLDEKILSTIFSKSFMPTFYDFVLIDNHPGIAKLQRASLHAADFVFIPTELQQLAVNGLSIMMQYLTKVFHFKADHVRIIVNKYRETIRQDSFYESIRNMFPDSATETAIPVDPIFDEIITDKKILFLDRLKSSRAVPFIVKLMTEIFPYTEDSLYDDILQQRNKHLADNARLRMMQSRNKRPGGSK
ncbi:MAG: ParA family protein [Fibrobacterota bacterium]